MKISRWIPWLILSLPLGCAKKAPPSVAPSTQPDPYAHAFEAGQAEAQAALARGTPTWLRLADRRAGGDPIGEAAAPAGLDQDTMIPWVAIDGADPAALGRITGNNQALRNYIDQNGLPDSSRARWERELLNLQTYFSESAKERRPAALVPSGPAIRSADGKYGLAWRLSPQAQQPSTLIENIGEGTPLHLSPLPVNQTGGQIQVAWGPSRSDTAIFHWTAQAAHAHWREGFSALDLRTGQWLRHEYTPRGGPGAAAVPE